MANDCDVREMALDKSATTSSSSREGRANPSTSTAAPQNVLGAPKTPSDATAFDANSMGNAGPGSKPSQSRNSSGSNPDTRRAYIDSVPVLTMKDFRENILPHSTSNEMIAALTESKAVENLRSQVNQARSANINNDESQFFRHIEDVIYADILAKGSARDISPTAKISHNPKGVPTSLERENSAIPDCNLLLKDSETESAKRIHFRDVFATFEFKKTACAQSRQDDFAKVIWTMRHIMREDPCRRFVFGITIENCDTRLWLANRAGVFVSEPFDYVEELAVFLEVLIRFTYASKSELGWDESMLREQRGSNTSYRIRVNNKWYATEKVLSNLAAEYIGGRATRVWKARDEQGNLVVLKDVWLDEGRMPEHDVQKELLASEKDERLVQLVKLHLFTIVAYEMLQVDGTVDNTRDTVMRGLQLREDGKVLRVKVSKPIRLPQNLSGITPGDSAAVQARQRSIQHRFHYRIVYEEVATPMYDVANLKDVFQACLDALVVLSFFSKNGWVHRDISAGNVYIYNGRGMVGDLEYVKKMSSGRKYEVRTGTADFWALEVEWREYLFPGHRVTAVSHRRAVHLSLGEIAEKRQRMKQGTTGESDGDNESTLVWKHLKSEGNKSPPPPFFHNPIHDVESLWWILIASIFKKRVVVGNSDGTDGGFSDYRQQLIHCRRIFPGCVGSTTRRDFFSKEWKFASITESLPPSLTKIVETLEGIREELVATYTTMESDLESDNPRLHHEFYSDGHIMKLYSLFESGVKYSEGMTFHEFPLKWIDGVGAGARNTEEMEEISNQSWSSPHGSERESTEQLPGHRPSGWKRYMLW